MYFTSPPPGTSAALAVLVIVAAAFDLKTRKIPNWLTAAGVVAGFFANHWTDALVGFAAGFSVYIMLYLLRAMGAGDVKLMAAVGAIAGARAWFAIFILTAVLGGVAALVLITVRGRFRKTMWNVGYILSEMTGGRAAWKANAELDVRNPKSAGLPHGAVIAGATLLFLALGAR